jgi:hypothetical protein
MHYPYKKIKGKRRKGKAIPVTGCGEVVRHLDSHIFQTIVSQMVVRLSALLAGHPLLPG